MPQIQNFITLFLSIIIESLPFVVCGVLISVAVALFVSERFIAKILPKNRLLSHVLIASLGIFIPVCQCGNVPVARRLILQGVSISQAVVFLLAAPLVNPITFLTTWEAFPLNHSVAVIRILAGLFIACSVGIYVSYQNNQENFLTKEFNEQCHTSKKPQRSFSFALHTFQSEFIIIMKMLCLGSLVAAFVQAFVPREIIFSVGQNIYLSLFAMLLLGFVISICSTVDAFFALSYINSFSLGSIVTFLVFGPLVDIKMLFMMKTIFKTKVLLLLSIFIATVSVIIGFIINQFHLFL